jgi:hypothetical protein
MAPPSHPKGSHTLTFASGQYSASDIVDAFTTGLYLREYVVYVYNWSIYKQLCLSLEKFAQYHGEEVAEFIPVVLPLSADVHEDIAPVMYDVQSPV